MACAPTIPKSHPDCVRVASSAVPTLAVRSGVSAKIWPQRTWSCAPARPSARSIAAALRPAQLKRAQPTGMISQSLIP